MAAAARPLFARARHRRDEAFETPRSAAGSAVAVPGGESGGTVLASAPSLRDRASMHNSNKLKIGLFGANCSSGRAVTLVRERWSRSWPDNLKLARLADEAGLAVLASQVAGFSRLFFARVRIKADDPPRVLPLRDGVALKERFRRAVGAER